ncbi:hypothetical protein H0G86_013116 [Trichoderma simmonsii]|uniref:Uncharacterized protein n=1 Tax=Trichoderma simmonsii TaxID=1491479 RepID=A0A8G0LV20_9HYPO|nr:hypothetical protein H0G86_013116 [Trichoderma simmonsii]
MQGRISRDFLLPFLPGEHGSKFEALLVNRSGWACHLVALPRKAKAERSGQSHDAADAESPFTGLYSRTDWRFPLRFKVLHETSGSPFFAPVCSCLEPVPAY